MGRTGNSMVPLKTVKKFPLQLHQAVKIRYVKIDWLWIILYSTFRYNVNTLCTLTHRQTSVRTCCQDLHSSAVKTWLILTPLSKPVCRTCANVTVTALHAYVQPSQSTPASALIQAGTHSNGRLHNYVVRTATRKCVCYLNFDVLAVVIYQNHCF